MTPLYACHSVRRWHANPCHALRDSGDTTGAHAARCVSLLLHLYPAAPRELIIATLHHDAHEADLGDVPANAPSVVRDGHAIAARAWDAEARLPCLKDLGAQWVKLVDRLDAYLWVRDVAPYVLASPEWQSHKGSLLAMARRLNVGAEVEGML